jgi:hypothetical protein
MDDPPRPRSDWEAATEERLTVLEQRVNSALATLRWIAGVVATVTAAFIVDLAFFRGS